MSIKTQTQILDVLEKKSVKALDVIRNKAHNELISLLKSARVKMRSAIFEIYRGDFNADWNLSEASRRGTLLKIGHAVDSILIEFKQAAFALQKKHYSHVYRESALRSAWMLDQITPNSISIKIPPKIRFMESMDNSEVTDSWASRFALWVDGYRSSLDQNLRLGAINESSADDARQEVDATRVGTPATDLEYAISRMFMTTSLLSELAGQQDVADLNEGIDVVQIWQTRYWDRVCDICDENRGLTMDEATDDIPAHPNCACYWRMVPRKFADLLRSGNAEDMAAAIEMDAAGLDPSSVAMLDPESGELKGLLSITFNEWKKGMPTAIMGAM